MKHIITIGLAVIVAIFATSIVFSFVDYAPIVGPLLISSFVGGLFLGGRIANSLAYKRPTRSPRGSRTLTPTTSLFADRLRAFAGKSRPNNGTIEEPQTSQMPFWMRDSVHVRKDHKTPSYIRRILVRIRTILAQSRG